MTSFLWVLTGFCLAFFVSFLALIGWWFLIISRDPTKTGEEIRQSFDKVRDSIRRHNDAAKWN